MRPGGLRSFLLGHRAFVMRAPPPGPAARSGARTGPAPAISGGGRRPHLTREEKILTSRWRQACLTPRPVSGNLGACGQQFWLGPARAGRTLTLWIDTTTVHLSLAGQHLKTLPSRLTTVDLARLRAQGARPAGPSPPARPSWTQLSGGAPVEIQRTGPRCHWILTGAGVLIRRFLAS